MITARPDAPEGSVLHLPSYSPSSFLPDAAVLCRNNAPLAVLATQLLRRHVPCHLVGNDLKARLERLRDRIQREPSYRDREVKRLEAKQQWRKRDTFLDFYHTLIAIQSAGLSIDTLCSSTSGVTMSTIHRAKGLEWPTVFLLDWHLFDPGNADPQERNLQHVAVTRAMESIVYITSNKWKDKV